MPLINGSGPSMSTENNKHTFYRAHIGELGREQSGDRLPYHLEAYACKGLPSLCCNFCSFAASRRKLAAAFTGFCPLLLAIADVIADQSLSLRSLIHRATIYSSARSVCLLRESSLCHRQGALYNTTAPCSAAVLSMPSHNRA